MSNFLDFDIYKFIQVCIESNKKQFLVDGNYDFCNDTDIYDITANGDYDWVRLIDGL